MKYRVLRDFSDQVRETCIAPLGQWDLARSGSGRRRTGRMAGWPLPSRGGTVLLITDNIANAQSEPFGSQPVGLAGQYQLAIIALLWTNPLAPATREETGQEERRMGSPSGLRR